MSDISFNHSISICCRSHDQDGYHTYIQFIQLLFLAHFTLYSYETWLEVNHYEI